MKKKNIFTLMILAAISLTGCGAGQNSQTSSQTGDNSSESEAPAHVHNFGSWSIETLPTETTTGKAKRTCSCGDVDEVTLPILADKSYTKSADTATCTKAGAIHYSITISGNLFEFDIATKAHGHNYVVQEDEGVTASYLYAGKTVEKCQICGDKKETPIEQLKTKEQLGVISDDYFVTLSGHNVTNAAGENKITNGLFVIGSEEHQVIPQIDDGSAKDRVFLGGGINPDSRLILINVAAKCKLTVKLGAKTSGTETSLALFDSTGDLTGRTNYIEGEIATTSSTSNKEHTYNLNKAGLYALGTLSGSVKVSNMTFEFHEVDDSKWVYDETQHWHPSTGSSCILTSEKENHEFGEPVVRVEPQIGVEGDKVYTCSVCKYEKHVPIPALTETTYGFDNTHHWVEGNEGDKVAHTDGEVTVIKEASYLEDGSGKATCSVCKKEHDVVLPKLEIENFGEISTNQELLLNADNVTNTTGVNKIIDGFAVIGSEEHPLKPEGGAAGGTDRVYLSDLISGTGNMILIKLATACSVSVRFGSKSKNKSNLGVFNTTPNEERNNAIDTRSASSSSNVVEVFELEAGLYAIGSIGGKENNIKVSNIVITVK